MIRRILGIQFFLAVVVYSLLVNQSAWAQGIDLKPYRLEPKPPSGTMFTRINDMYAGRVRVKGPDFKSNQEVLKQFAQAAIYRLTFDSYYNLPESGELKPRSPDQNIDALIAEMNTRVLVPTPDRDLPRLTLDQVEYIVEYGAALDAAIADVFAKSPPAIIRVNAARFLSIAAKSGAPAHAKSILAMLNNTYFKDRAGKPIETPPEVLYFAIKGAENLLAAYDFSALNSEAVTRHALPEADLVALCSILNDMVVKGPNVADKTAMNETGPSGRPADLAPAKEAQPPTPPTPPTPPSATTVAPPQATATAAKTPEQIAVVLFYRREAIRALAKVRFDIVGRGETEVRVGYTLAKVATNDSSLSYPANAVDAAEATLGLLGILPTTFLNTDVWALSVAQGINNLVAPKVADDVSTVLPWKQTAARLGAALNQLKKNIAVTPRLRIYAKQLNDLIDVALADIVAPLERDSQAGINRPATDRLGQWITGHPPKGPSGSLFNDSDKFKLNPRRPGT